MTLAVESNILVKRREYRPGAGAAESGAGVRCLPARARFNSGKSLSAGLPVYARNQVKAIAAILERARSLTAPDRCGGPESRCPIALF